MLKKRIKAILTRLRYRGNKYTCPICGYHAKTFLPAGLYAKRENEKCPSCGSLTRHRHVWLFLEEYLKEKKAVNILHFSPEKPIAERLAKREGVNYKTSQYDRNVPRIIIWIFRPLIYQITSLTLLYALMYWSIFLTIERPCVKCIGF